MKNEKAVTVITIVFENGQITVSDDKELLAYFVNSAVGDHIDLEDILGATVLVASIHFSAVGAFRSVCAIEI